MSDVDKILEERGKEYGKFENHAQIVHDLKEVIELTPRWDFLKPDHKEALHMIMHKIARILNGNPESVDQWVDIAGYAQLIVHRINKTGVYAEPQS